MSNAMRTDEEIQWLKEKARSQSQRNYRHAKTSMSVFRKWAFALEVNLTIYPEAEVLVWEACSEIRLNSGFCRI